MLKNKIIIIMLFFIIVSISILGYVFYISNSNNKNLTVSLTENSLPEKFSLADVIDIKVENQGNLDLCWAYAAVKSLETNISLKTRRKPKFIRKLFRLSYFQ